MISAEMRAIDGIQAYVRSTAKGIRKRGWPRAEKCVGISIGTRGGKSDSACIIFRTRAGGCCGVLSPYAEQVRAYARY